MLEVKDFLKLWYYMGWLQWTKIISPSAIKVQRNENYHQVAKIFSYKHRKIRCDAFSGDL